LAEAYRNTGHPDEAARISSGEVTATPEKP
jgi:hypothetical protein